MRFLSAFLLPLFLSGCLQFGSAAIQDTTDAHSAAKAFVFERIGDRIRIRDWCRKILEKEIDSLVNQEKYEEARELLLESYPTLLTTSLITEIIDDDGKINFDALNTPELCGKLAS